MRHVEEQKVRRVQVSTCIAFCEVISLPGMPDLTSPPHVLKHLHNVPAGKLQVLAGRGSLDLLRVNNRAASTIYVLLYDQTAQPANGEVPDRAPIEIPPGDFTLTSFGMGFSSGCWLAISATATTLTANGADVWVDAGGSH